MPNFLTQYIELWKRLKAGQRVAVVAAIVATLGLTGALIYYGSQPTYGVLSPISCRRMHRPSLIN
ncbi:MAG: hypothetical protein WKF84_01115 [Pyrinomonadaceae bacterium]